MSVNRIVLRGPDSYRDAIEEIQREGEDWQRRAIAYIQEHKSFARLALDTGISRRTVQEANRKDGPSRIRATTAAKLTRTAGLHGRDAAKVAGWLVNAVFCSEAVRTLHAFSPLIFEEAGSERVEEFGMAYGFYIRSTRRDSDQKKIQARIAETQKYVMDQAEPGWVTIVAKDGLYVTAANKPLRLLLNWTDLDHASLIDPLFIGRMSAILANFEEWILVIGMFTAAIRQYNRGKDLAYAESFFAWLRDHVRLNEAKVFAQVEAAPAKMAQTETRETLRQCFRAARDDASWPSFQFNDWNSIRVHVKHPLLEGETARFLKVARPIPDPDDPAAYEVIWHVENYDSNATRLMQLIQAIVKSDDIT